MAYIPTEWETGDVITAEKLNNMEQGIEDAFVAPAVTISDEGDVLTVNSSGEWVNAAPASQLPEVAAADQGKVLTVDSSGDWIASRNVLAITVSENTLSATWQEINDAFPNVYVVMETPPFGAGRSAILSTMGGGSVYKVLVQGTAGTSVEYKTTTADGYPVWTNAE